MKPEDRAVLEQLFLLRACDAAAAAEFMGLAHCHAYPKGNLLYYHGEPVDALYVVLSGHVNVSMMHEDGREVLLASVRPPNVLGLVAALDGGNHAGTAVTGAPCSLARIRRDDFLRFLAAHGELYQPIAAQLASLLRVAYERLGEQALLPVKKRLLAALIQMARDEGFARADGDEVTFVRPTHQELAARVGSSREVVTRVLKQLLEEEEALSAQGRVMRVVLHSVVLPESELGG
jgi:CRP/FNR family transcriptional regulator, cyclic AMP receptor protein